MKSYRCFAGSSLRVLTAKPLLVGLALCLDCTAVGLLAGNVASPAVQANVPAPLQLPQIHKTGSNTFRIGRVDFDKTLNTISIPVKVRLRREVIEYALVTEQGKAYESLLTTDASPTDLHLAFLLLGIRATTLGDAPGLALPIPESSRITIHLSWRAGARVTRLPLSELVQLTSGQPDPKAPSIRTDYWLYNGSLVTSNGFAAQREGSIISLIQDPTALVNNPGSDRNNDLIHFPKTKLLPPEGAEIRLIFGLNQKPLQGAR